MFCAVTLDVGLLWLLALGDLSRSERTEDTDPERLDDDAWTDPRRGVDTGVVLRLGVGVGPPIGRSTGPWCMTSASPGGR